jgi:hypoxanthine phosphoribosyltransferase|tara:strand:+ start:1403 stop:2170 length:768 start_codon:yes stop_codon:yes gene_type:complete
MEISFKSKNKSYVKDVTTKEGSTFTVDWDDYDNIPKPYSSKKELAKWYKLAPKRKDNKKEAFSRENKEKGGTIKNCIPVFDAISSGYIIPLSAEVHISIAYEDDLNIKTVLYSKEGAAMWSGHVFDQYKAAPFEGRVVCKFDNPWIIQTPPGYSCLFTKPFFQESQSFEVLTGIVDTDNYINPVSFPMIIDPSVTELTIPKEFPLVQVIPFKRDSWSATVITDNPKENKLGITHEMNKFGIDAYKNLYWEKKTYE